MRIIVQNALKLPHQRPRSGKLCIIKATAPVHRSELCHAAEEQDGAESDDDFDKRLAAVRKNKMAPGSQRKAKTPYQQLQENKQVGRAAAWHSLAMQWSFSASLNENLRRIAVRSA